MRIRLRAKSGERMDVAVMVLMGIAIEFRLIRMQQSICVSP